MTMFLERRLRSVSQRLSSSRADLAATNEQLDQLADEADDAAMRALVSDDPSASLDSNDAVRHRDALARHRASLIEQIAELEQKQDALLDEFNDRRGGPA